MTFTYPGKCEPCRQVDHSNCSGRPACACNICYSREIMANARQAITGTNSVQVLRAVARDLYGLQRQRQAIYEAAKSRPSRPGFCPVCGERFVIQGFGRPRRTCSGRCRQALHVARAKQRELEAATSGGPGDPAGGGPGSPALPPPSRSSSSPPAWPSP